MGLHDLVRLQFERAPTTQARLDAAIEAFIGDFQMRRSVASTEDERIEAVTTLYRDLEQLHPFRDGNFRMFGLYFLNLALMIQGLEPTVLHDPNQTDGNSPRANVANVREGQAWLRRLRSQPGAPPLQPTRTPDDDAVARGLAALLDRRL